MRRYDLAYNFIPYLISEFNSGKIPQKVLLDIDFLKYVTKDEFHEFSWDELKIEHQILSKTKSVGIYIFPEPERMPEAKFGLLFFDFKQKSTKYYTLEKSISPFDNTNYWVIGSISEDGKAHLNFGSFDKEPTKDKFVNYIY